MSMQRQSNVQHLERQRDQLCGVVDQGVLNNAVSMLYYSVAPDNRPQECTRILNELSALLVPNPLQVFIRMWTDAVGGTLVHLSVHTGDAVYHVVKHFNWFVLIGVGLVSVLGGVMWCGMRTSKHKEVENVDKQV
jgi:hypothetical protein